MALSKAAREYLEKVHREKEERKQKREGYKGRRAEREKQAAELEAARIAEEQRKASDPAPPAPPAEPTPVPEPPPVTMFPVPYWLSNPRSPYYSEELVQNPNFQIEFKLPDGSTHWKSHPGPQTYALLCGFEELLVGGRRGGGKSVFLIAKPAMGDSSLPLDDPAHYSFLNDRSFRGLFLREEYQSLVEFIEEAKEFFKPFGGTAKGDPVYIDFKSGARIYFNHLQDENAFKKYKGWNLTFIGIEELTTVRTLRQYLRLLGSLRSAPRVRVVRDRAGREVKKTFPPLRTQIAATTNPDGPGAAWVADRFVKVPGKDGKIIFPSTPLFDTITLSYRIFIPFPIEANPTYAEDTAAGRRYRSMLMAQDEVTRRQWMLGDWDAGSSLFFTEYRAEGPVGEEEAIKYPWARHFIKPVALQPWWHRWGGGDHGFDHPAAFHKFCRNESDHRVHIYDEMQMRHVGAFEQGARLAQWWQPELVALQKAGQLPCVVVHLGSDAFSKNDEVKTIAERMMAGICEVLGPYGAIMLKYDDDEREAMLKNPRRAQQMFQQRIAKLEGRMAIALKPAYIDRKAAWDYMREMIRFRPAIMHLQTPEQRDKYLRDVLHQQGREAYEHQAEKLRSIKPEILPKLQIWDCCTELDRCLKAAQKDMRGAEDPTKVSKQDDVLKFNCDLQGDNGDDALESARNAIVAYKEIETTMPLSYFVSEKMAEAQEQHIAEFGSELTDNTRLMMIAQTQTARYNAMEKKTTSFTLPRASSQRHRVN